ncbi:M23 family metallopeptidase [Chitinophaga nivalis]|uniref:M23 family metallopeptidase n=1 Tax=Chitinophaga nivalis TaxID=2991709 RepID=A0ABT3IQ24_9BACT|nr:M23 family metallopeptidase [Chitinophaga nivalis]MCW3464286.1 M23 family metallopeptidase [Chitinophaga nivalis]MCW3486023.1 M23 family metallopeptidase [Chitinophaga nivalis]
MIIYSLLGITLALAAYSLYLVWKAGNKPLAATYTYLLLGLSLGAFLYLYGTWVYLSIYTKYIFGFLLLLCSNRWIFHRHGHPAVPTALYRRVSNLVLTGLFTTAVVLYFTGTTGKPQTVALTFPLRSGQYFVLQGGKGLPTNVFHYSLRGAIYAMDIVKLNQWGGRANQIFSRKLDDYVIFNDTVYAPCDGLVQRAYSNNPDNIPPAMDRGPKNTNQVLLETTHCYVFVAHLKMGSVVVQEGQYVKQGQALGCVGNSGFSTEPHLHMQAHSKEAGIPWYKGKPLYMLFNGKGYLLNEVINAR